MTETLKPVEHLASPERMEAGQPVEAVIISGPRRGEIVRLPEGTIPEVSDEDIRLLNAALDQVEAALDRFECTVDLAIERFRASPEAA
jgi:hypothetical protein